MAKIVNTRNNGNPSIRYGEVLVNSSNVSPTSVVAVPAPGAAVITLPLLDSFEFFVGAQTGAATDRLVLPELAPVGTQITIYATNSFGVIRAGSDTINNVSTIVTITALGTAWIRKVSATAWILTNFASNGAVTAPTT